MERNFKKTIVNTELIKHLSSIDENFEVIVKDLANLASQNTEMMKSDDYVEEVIALHYVN